MINKDQAIKWTWDYFDTHDIFKSDSSDTISALRNGCTEIFLYKPLITDDIYIKIVNVEIVPEIIFISRLPETEVEFIQLMHLVRF